MIPRVFLACLLICVIVGCSNRGSTSQRSDLLIIARLSEPVSLNSLYLQGSDAADVSALGYSFLTNYDVNNAIIADTATVVPTIGNHGISRDGKRIVYHLRHDITWWDGYPLTARDVVFTYRAGVNPSNTLPSGGGYNPISRVFASNPYSVVVELKRPYAPIITTFFGGDGNPILPAHLLAAYPNLNHVAFNAAPVGSGPYRFVRWLHGDRLDLTANDRYYGTKPEIQKISIRFVHDHSTIVNELMTGEVDATFFASPSKVGVMRSIPNHRVVVTRQLPKFGALVFNVSDSIVKDLAVRQAFASAIDRRTLVAKTASGLYDADTGMRGLFSWAFDPNVGTIAYDPVKARALLTHAGWTLGNDGIRVKNGRRLEMQFVFGDSPLSQPRLYP